MRLPFLQLESDLVSSLAGAVGQLAGCSPAQALGHVALLRAWVISKATDDAPPDGWVAGDGAERKVEAAAQWSGAKGALVQALVDTDLLAHEAGGLRVLRLDPYVTAWERNAKAKARMANARERSANKRERAGTSGEVQARDGAIEAEPSAKFMGKTQTQMEDVEVEEPLAGSEPRPPMSHISADELPDATEHAELEPNHSETPNGSNHPKIPGSSPRPAAGMPARAPETARQAEISTTPLPQAPERAELRLVSPRAARTRKPSAAEVLYSKLEETRRQRCEEAGVEFVAEDWAPARQNTSLGRFAKLAPPEQERFEAAWAEYLSDDSGASRNPPWSVGWFLASKSTWESKALRGAS